MEGCVDIWNMEVLKAGKGAHFKTPIHPSCNWEKMESTLKHQLPTNVFVTSHNSEHLTLRNVVSEPQYRKITENTRQVISCFFFAFC